MATADWRDDCIKLLRERNRKEVYPFYDIKLLSSRLQSENDMLERKLITITRQISILRHDSTQALSDILLSKPVPPPTTAPLITPTPNKKLLSSNKGTS